MKIKYYPELSAKEAGLYVIRGPRQVGKTTLMKLIIQEQLKKNNEKSVFYYSFDLIKSREEAYEAIKTYLDEIAVESKKYYCWMKLLE